MRTLPFFILSLALIALLTNCVPTPVQDSAYNPGFFYLSLTPEPMLIFSDAPGSSIRAQIKLSPPTDCSLFAIHPAPLGHWIAVEWECTFGPAVELFDTVSKKSHFALSDPTIDSRFLAWQPDGNGLYLKIGTLSVPQTLRINAASRKAVELNISPFVYDLLSTPDGKRILYSLSKGIGFGSETWLAGPEGQNPSQLLVDDKNIIALAQYSPDGSQIAFISFKDDQTPTPSGELWLMDSGGFHPRKLAIADAGRGFAPAWSPDGTKIVFAGREQKDDPNSISVSIYNLTQEKLTSIMIAPSTQPTWSSDGSLITFSSIPTIQNGGDKMNVWLYEMSSKQVKKLVSSACCAGWIR
jgi:Tol biopolymer transport system component